MKARASGLHLTIIVAALGYFVDIYDLLLFGIVRMPSLKDLGVPPEEMMATGLHLLNMQMTGMLIGGIAWGILGDRRGRKSVLFGSILLYSLANIANAFVVNTSMYAALRLIAGVGLAGELGAAITLVSEVMSTQNRGYGTSIVAGVGILGAVFASLIGDFFSWKVAYIIGGVMGLGLLILRAGLLESKLFDAVKSTSVRRGSFLKLFTDFGRFRRYLACILVGVPIWFVIGVLITFAPELGHQLGISGATGSKAIMWAYVGLSAGDLASGLLSQWLKSRRLAILIFLSLTTALILVYVNAESWSLGQFYALCCGLGFGTGYWAVFVTVAAEQFGTNIRATAATTVPNFVRGSVVPITLLFKYLGAQWGLLNGALIVGGLCLALAFIALWQLAETFGRELQYVEPL